MDFTANIFNRSLFSYIFDTPIGIGVENNSPRINRLGTGFSFSRPLGPATTASLGLRFERVSITNSSNNAISATDSLGNPLSASGT